MSDNTGRVQRVARQGPRPDEVRDVPDQSGPRPRRLDPRSEWFWPVINLIGLIVAVAVTALANIVPFNGQTTTDVLTRNPVYFQPAAWTLLIQVLIFLLLAVFVVYSLLPAGRRNPHMRPVGLLFSGTNIATVVWLVVWHHERWTASVVAMALLLAALVLIAAVLRRRRPARQRPTAAERWMVWLPFSLYLGWITMALLVNVTVWADRTGWDRWAIAPRWWAVLLILLAVLITAAVAFWPRDPVFALAVPWALLGIAAEQWERSKAVTIAAIIGVVLTAALTFLASVLAYERREFARMRLPQPTARSRIWNRLRSAGQEQPETADRDNRHDGASS